MTHSHHLRDEEFVDLIDGTLPDSRGTHLQACATCSEQAREMRELLGRTSEVSVPEPSPLFWDHLSARIRDSAAGPAPAAPGWRAWSWRPAALGMVVATCLVLAASAGYFSVNPPSTTIPPVTSVAAVVDGRIAVDDPADDIEADEAWAVVRSVAEDVAWDDARDAGISARPGAADGLVLEMTRAERSALAQVLEDELKRSGA